MANTYIKLEGLAMLEQTIPNWLEEGQQAFVHEIGGKLADAVHDASPKGSIPFKGEALDSNTVRIYSVHPGAKALDQGAYIKAKGKRLKFEIGGRLIFMRAVRLPARKYTKKGLRKRNSIVQTEFERAFGHLGE